MNKELNEDCGCNSTTENIRSASTASTSRYSQDALVGKSVSLVDGRSGKVDDSIRNNTGEVIGYVIEGDKGNYRIFKNKISGVLDESGAMATLASTPGQGDVMPPLPGGAPGSGDQFPTLTAGTPAAKKANKEAKAKDKKVYQKEKDPTDTSVLSYEAFLKNSKLNQGKPQNKQK